MTACSVSTSHRERNDMVAPQNAHLVGSASSFAGGKRKMLPLRLYLRLCVFGGCQELTLQSCLIGKMEGLEGLTSLTRLTLYDNQILSLNVPPSLSGLTHLDMSYNLIRGTSALAGCPLLEEVRVLEADGGPLWSLVALEEE